MAEFVQMTNAEYHADPKHVGSTMLKTLLKSPADYYDLYVAKTRSKPETPAMLLGSLLHTLVLEPETRDDLYYVRPDGIDGRTREGKAFLAQLALVSVGKREVKADAAAKAEKMAAAVLASTCVADILAVAQRELTVFWDEPMGEWPVACKARLDLFVARPDQPRDLILDLKTSDDPTPEAFGRDGDYGPIAKFRYDLQLAHYAAGTETATGRACDTGLIVVGSDEPHDVYLYDMTDYLEQGTVWRQGALGRLVACRVHNQWHRPEQRKVNRLSPGQWSRQP